VSLRQKTTLTVSLGVFLLMLSVYVLLSTRTLESALELEQRDLERNLVRAKNVILNELSQLELTALDWAVFDETYEFVLGKNPRYIERNLTRNLEILDLEFFIIQIKAVQLEAKLERSRSTELAASLEETRLELFERLARIAEFRDNETGLHTSRVGEVSYALAIHLELLTDESERLRYASRLHDIGKIAIPDSILFKPSGLDTHEWLLMQTHATLGGQMLEDSGSDPKVVDALLEIAPKLPPKEKHETPT
jgi:HD-GYP domain-containing protein (c-di-GMP phosphodiesterase class II)